MATISTAYIAASTNRHPQAADISTSSILAFGSSNLIALWDIGNGDEHGISETLPGHEGLVTCVYFVSDSIFISTDDKGMLISWRRCGSQWKSTAMIQAHGAAISSLCALDKCVATGSSDASVKIWKLVSTSEESDSFIEEQNISLQGKYPLTLSLTYLPQSKAVLLAIGGTDSNIHIWIRSEHLFVHGSILTGHEDWVKCLAFRIQNSQGEPLILASGSQDATIRLWSIEHWGESGFASQTPLIGDLNDELLDAFEASLGDVGGGEEGGRQVSLKRHILTVKSDQGRLQQFSITFDALLIRHESAVTSVAWKPVSAEVSPTLLSTSTDSSLILWSPSATIQPSHIGSTSLWINHQRFGDIGGQRLGGFVGGIWANAGNEALAWGWAGGWRRWSSDTSGELWAEVGAISGHRGPIKGLDWSPTGNYLISAGLDQTTRIHSAIVLTGAGNPSWHELSRPQVHGYDLLDAAFIDPLRFVSIADEKVARVFEAPRGFIGLVETLGVAKFTKTEYTRPLGASVPPLGLSNKALEEGPQNSAWSERSRRPFEGELASTTLWPEVEKVFGHGYELMTLAVSPRRQLMATACKATTAEHAVVRVYDTTKYHLLGQPLEGHSLTVTRIAFSPDENHILSVSRDRSWRLYAIQEDGVFTPVATDKSHGRIIWDCAWAAENDIFATASRDKTVKIWQQKEANNWHTAETIKTNASATAVAFAPGGIQHRRRLAIGLETGEILIYSNLRSSTSGWRHDMTIPTRMAHVSQIHRLAWQPVSGVPVTLASCSEDGTLKVSVVQITID